MDVLLFHGLQRIGELCLVLAPRACLVADDNLKIRKLPCDIPYRVGLVRSITGAPQAEDQYSLVLCNLFIEAGHQAVVQLEVGVASPNAAAGGHLELENGEIRKQVVQNFLCITAIGIEGGYSCEMRRIFLYHFL